VAVLVRYAEVIETRVRVLDQDREQAVAFCRAFAKLKPGPISESSSRVEKENQFAGKLAEIVAGRVLGLPVDLSVHAGKDHGDLVLRDGRTLGVRAVAVHTTLNFDFNVIVRPHESKVDLITLALVAPKWVGVIFCGYVPAAEFHRNAVVNMTWRRQKVRGSDVDQPWTLRRSQVRHAFEELIPETPAIEIYPPAPAEITADLIRWS
jgi:hypothetical protein